MGETAKFCCLVGLEHGPLALLHLHQFFGFDDFLHYLSLAVLELAL
jgi:hypothetical protein